MSQLIGPFTRNCINTIVHEIKKKDNRDKISNYIIKPLLSEMLSRCYPYIFSFLIIQLIIIVLLVYILMKLKNEKLL